MFASLARIAAESLEVGKTFACILEVESRRSGHLDGLLTPCERARADRFRRDEDRACFVFGRILVRSLVGEVGPPRSFETTVYGKPYLTDRPAFNLSHATGLVAVAVTPAKFVGIDVERPQRGAEVEELIPSIAHANERGAIRLTPPYGKQAVLADLWTRKEAALKAVGFGLVDNLAGLDTKLSESCPLVSVPPTVRLWPVRTPRTTACIALPPDAAGPVIVVGDA